MIITDMRIQSMLATIRMIGARGIGVVVPGQDHVRCHAGRLYVWHA